MTLKKYITRTVRVIYQIFIKWLLNPLLKYEYHHPWFNKINERPVEYAFVFNNLSELFPKDVLDVGTGRSSLPHTMAGCGIKVTAIDQINDYWQGGFINRHFHVIKDDITKPEINKSFDLITCISTLEHIENSDSAIEAMVKLLNTSGHIILTFPYNENEYIRNVYDLPDSGYGQDSNFICQMYSRNELNRWLGSNDINIIKQEYYEVFSGQYWSVGERIYPPKKVTKEQKHHLTCLLLGKSN